ncbi:hypothetical protein [Streptomyces sp. SM11]|uniref:hypothetical protein n=1 Tax=Streptomyces sp. SM11 TaxID=565557 RepID=UPI0015E1A9A4|nr:hypothetical protein [Streptomyces sp. SM11]
MTTAVIIAVAAVAAIAAYFPLRGRLAGGRGLRSRFGPEYERVVARHGGGTTAAEQELGGRVKRHGHLDEHPLTEGAHAGCATHWASSQELLVESPESNRRSGRSPKPTRCRPNLSRERGFPAGEDFEDRTDSLSVHHAAPVDGYRRVHTARRGNAGTRAPRICGSLSSATATSRNASYACSGPLAAFPSLQPRMTRPSRSRSSAASGTRNPLRT